MPKLSPATWDARRREVLEAAFRCFARHGYHGTTVDDVIAESGLSSSVVYRYVRGKDEMIAAAIEETRSTLAGVATDLVGRDPVPSPREALQSVLDILDDDRHGRHYSLKHLVMQTWVEAIGTPTIGAQARESTEEVRRHFATLATRWKRLGYLPDSMRAADAAAMFTLATYGLVVDNAHLDGVSTRGALRQLRALDRPR